MKKNYNFSGDPNSINSEIIYKSLKKIKNSLRKKIYNFKFKVIKRTIQNIKIFNTSCYKLESKRI